MGTIGKLNIKIRANSDALKKDLADGNSAVRSSASQMQSDFDRVDFKTSREGAMLLNEQLSLHLPRALTGLISKLPGLGVAFAAAMPLLAVGVFVTKIVELVDHLSKIGEAAKKAGSDYAELALGTERHAQAMTQENLKLEDQLRMLNGKPPINGPAIAMEEARRKAEELTAQIVKAINAEKELLTKQSINFWQSLLGNTQTDDLVKPIIEAKEAISALERIQGIAITAKDAATVASTEKELSVKRAALAVWIAEQQSADDKARDKKLTDDLASAKLVNKKRNDELAGSGHRMSPDQAAKAEAEFQKQTLDHAKEVNDTFDKRKDILTSSNLQLKAETEEIKEQKRQAADVAAVKGATDRNAAANAQARVNAELQKHTDEQRTINSLTEKEALATQVHAIHLQAASGIITKIQEDQQLAALYAATETKEIADKNAELAKQFELVKALGEKTNNGTTGTTEQKAAYNQGLSEYNKFLKEKEELTVAFKAREYKTEEDAAAKELSLQASIVSETQKHANEQTALNELVDKDALALAVIKVRLQESSGLISKSQADRKLLVLYATAEKKEMEEQNIRLAKQEELVKNLAKLTNNGTAGTDAQRAEYNKQLTLLHTYLTDAEKLKATFNQKEVTAQQKLDQQILAAKERSLNAVASMLNTGVQSAITGQESFGQAAQKVWQNFATTAVMSLIQISEQEIIAHILHKAIKEDEKVIYAKSIYWKVYDALADIPIVGPVLAPIAGAAAFATVMAFKEGGIVPGGVETGVPILAHGGEMVLPHRIASMVTDMAKQNKSGGRTNGDAGSPVYSPTINIPPGASAKEYEAHSRANFNRWARSEAMKRGQSTR